MQENWLELANAFDNKSHQVLATIIDTEGATYQKVGTMMLVNKAGQCSGLLSGGCLEADIAQHAEQVLCSGLTKVLSYDLSSSADLIWGLGLGCEGKVDILLIPLTPENDFMGVAEMLSNTLAGNSGFYYQLLVDEQEPVAQYSNNGRACAGMQASLKSERPEQSLVLKIPTYAPVSLLICGAGPDAVPVASFAQQMGWQVSVWDHRKASLSRPEFAQVNATKCIRAEQVSVGELIEFDAVVVMTHSLENDQSYLKQLLLTELLYIGLLGPVNRRDKLLKNLGYELAQVANRLFGPVGLDIGGRSPQAIALSIIAQIQKQLTDNKISQLEKPSIV